MRLALIAMLIVGCATGPADADLGAIRVRVLDRGVPIAGAQVLFHDPTGALIARATTDADGGAFGDVPDGSMVTVFTLGSIAQLPWLRTIRAAARGDVLVFGQLRDLAWWPHPRRPVDSNPHIRRRPDCMMPRSS